jgi:hypothetical protein
MPDKNRLAVIMNTFRLDEPTAEYVLAQTLQLIKDIDHKDDKPNRNEVTEALRRYFNLDFSQIEAVMDYAYGKSQDRDKPNDYAIAKALNERAIEIFTLYADHSTTPDITDVNRSYVLLADELKKIYERTPELKSISETTCWHNFDRIEYIHDEVWGYTNNMNGDYGQSHNAVINTLIIKSGINKPTLTNNQKRLLDEADKAIADFKQELTNIEKNKDRDWYIPEYNLTRKDDGSILVNGVLVLSKTHAGQVPDKMMDFAFNHDGQEPAVPAKNVIATNRPFTTILGDMGFDATLRALFFPVVSKTKGISFRSHITRGTANTENIDTNELDHKLKDLNAKTEYANTIDDKPIDLSQIPF